jgi:type II secretory pathway component PulF
MRELERSGLRVIRIAELAAQRKSQARRVGRGRVPLKEMAVVARQLAIMSETGVPLTDALGCVREQVASGALGYALDEVIQDVLEGRSLTRALSRHPRVFSRLFVDMVRAGEASGQLSKVLDELASYLENNVDIAQRIRAAVAYPTVLMSVSLVAVILLVTFVLPRFAKLFEEMNVALPATTRAMMVCAGMLKQYWFVGPAIVIGAWMLARVMSAHEGGSETIDRIKLSLPIAGSISRRVNIARIGMAVSTALNGGVPLVEALGTAVQVTENRVLRASLVSVRESIIGGMSLADAFQQCGQFPPLVRQLVAAGERSGKLAYMLTRLSSYYSREADAEIKSLTAILEPVLIVVMGVLIGVIAVSIISPIYSVVESMK